MIAKEQRQRRIREILTRNEIRSQDQLQGLLLTESIDVAQATLSRDLREVGAVRGPTGYLIRANRRGDELDTKSLQRALHGAVGRVERGGTVVVLRTEPGMAPAVARGVDEAALPQVIGTIAGHDTVFVAAGSAGEARELARLLKKAARLR